jgi:bicarbonate transport system permease protein
MLAGLSIVGTTVFFVNVLFTLAKWAFAFGIGTTLGLFIGFISGINKGVEQFLLPLSSFLRSIPPIALFPVFLILLGPGHVPITLVGVLYVAIYVFPIASQSAESARSRFYELSAVLKLSRAEFLRTIIVPATVVSTIVSSRIAASFLFAIIIADEIIIGGNKGIGAAINENAQKYLLEESYFYIVTTGVLGLAVDLVLATLQGKNYRKMI